MSESLAAIMRKAGVWKPLHYAAVYERWFEPMRFSPLSVLELGVWNGGSINAWATYFPEARIAGVDKTLPPLTPHPRVRLVAGDQTDTAVLAQAAAEAAPGGFDIIIDDCSHIGALTKKSFWYLFENHLRPGGLYCIEDWGTGYMHWWPDGSRFSPEPDAVGRMPSHDAGMVGFIKQLIDDVHPALLRDVPDEPSWRTQLAASLLAAGAGDRGEEASRGEGPDLPYPPQSIFAGMSIYAGICVVEKASS